MTLKSAANAAAPIVLGVFATGLLFYYLGDKVPLIKEAAQGLNGDTANSGFFSSLFG